MLVLQRSCRIAGILEVFLLLVFMSTWDPSFGASIRCSEAYFVLGTERIHFLFVFSPETTSIFNKRNQNRSLVWHLPLQMTLQVCSWNYHAASFSITHGVPEKLCHWCYHGITSCPVLVELLEGEFKIWVTASVCKSKGSQIERDMPTYWGRVFATHSSIASGWNILAKIHGCSL